MCGCDRRAVMPISRRNLSAPTDAVNSGLRTLIATFRLCFLSSARCTVAMPPWPRRRSIVYRSASVLAREADASLMALNIRSALCLQAIRGYSSLSCVVHYTAPMLVVSHQHVPGGLVRRGLPRGDPRQLQ